MIFESQGVRYSECVISFIYNNEEKEFNSTNTKNLFKDVIDWLYDEGYEFRGDLHKKESTSRRVFSIAEVNDIVSRTSYEKRMFHNISNSGKYILFNSGVNQLFGDLIKMLVKFGISESTIKITFVPSSRTRRLDVREQGLFELIVFEISTEDAISDAINGTTNVIDKVHMLISKNTNRW